MKCVFRDKCDFPCGENTTEFKEIFKGTRIETVECARCGQMFQYPTDNPFNFCPICGARKVNGYDLLGLDN